MSFAANPSGRTYSIANAQFTVFTRRISFHEQVNYFNTSKDKYAVSLAGRVKLEIDRTDKSKNIRPRSCSSSELLRIPPSNPIS